MTAVIICRMWLSDWGGMMAGVAYDGCGVI